MVARPSPKKRAPQNGIVIPWVISPMTNRCPICSITTIIAMGLTSTMAVTSTTGNVNSGNAIPAASATGVKSNYTEST